MKKTAVIDLNKCDPNRCNPGKGICLAANACTHSILEQEEPFGPPVLLSESLCVGDSKCVAACPLKAIRISSGSYH